MTQALPPGLFLQVSHRFVDGPPILAHLRLSPGTHLAG